MTDLPRMSFHTLTHSCRTHTNRTDVRARLNQKETIYEHIRIDFNKSDLRKERNHINKETTDTYIKIIDKLFNALLYH